MSGQNTIRRGLPVKPMIGEAVLRRGPRPLGGPIALGEVFAWEPDLPYARELCIVRRLYIRQGEPWVETWDMDYTATHHNEESRFREAVVRTAFNLFPSEKPSLVREPLPSGFFERRSL